MACGWHCAKFSLSNALRLISFSGMCILLFLFLSLCRFCLFVFFSCSHWSLVDVPLIFFCPADHVPDWQPRTLLGMFEARSVNVKKTTTTTVDDGTCGPGVNAGDSRINQQDRLSAQRPERLAGPDVSKPSSVSDVEESSHVEWRHPMNVSGVVA